MNCEHIISASCVKGFKRSKVKSITTTKGGIMMIAQWFAAALGYHRTEELHRGRTRSFVAECRCLQLKAQLDRLLRSVCSCCLKDISSPAAISRYLLVDRASSSQRVKQCWMKVFLNVFTLLPADLAWYIAQTITAVVSKCQFCMLRHAA